LVTLALKSFLEWRLHASSSPKDDAE